MADDLTSYFDDLPEVPDFLGEQVFLRPGGTLVVAQNASENPTVLNYRAFLRDMGWLKEVETLPLSEFTDQRRRFMETRGTQDSATQKWAIQLFQMAEAVKASDIHIRIFFGSYADIYLRVNGELRHEAQWWSQDAHEVCATIYQSLSDSASVETVYKPDHYQDGRISEGRYLPEGVHAIRVASGPHDGGSVMVLRMLFQNTEAAQGPIAERMPQLGYTDHHTRTIRHMTQRASGIIYVAGPTGSGKSTTLKHVLEAISAQNPHLNILSIEDPPEYPIDGVVQMPVSGDQDHGGDPPFAAAIKHSLRSDPDVIMVGELRDRPSAWHALEAAETGHLVLATVHANSALDILQRVDYILRNAEDPEPMHRLANPISLAGMMFQKLCKRLCPSCSLPYRGHEDWLDNETEHHLHQILTADELDQVHLTGPGCADCNDSGTRGRTVLSEAILPDRELLRRLRNEGMEAAYEYWLDPENGQGGQTALSNAIDHIKAGEVDPETVEKTLESLIQEHIAQDGVITQVEVDSAV